MEQKKQIIKEEYLERLYQGFKNGLNSPKSEKPRAFLQNKGLDYNWINVGFNSGQFHHRTSKEFKKPYIELGILKKSDAGVNSPDKTPFTTFGRYGIIFPVYNRENRITNYYAYRFEIAIPKGEFLNDKGLYPHYPKPLTKRLFIVPTVMEAASFVQSGILENRESVLSLFEYEWKEQIYKAIDSLDELSEIVLINCKVPDNEFPLGVPTVSIQLEETINESYQAYGTKGLLSMINEKLENKESTPNSHNASGDLSPIEVLSDHEFIYKGEELEYKIFGVIPENPTLLEMQFEIRSILGEDVLRIKLNLMESQKVQKELFEWMENNDLNYGQCIIEINHITDELQALGKIKRQGELLPTKGYCSIAQNKAKELLKQENLFETIDKLLGESGIIGEEKNRLLLFIIAASYKFDYNMHAVIQSDLQETASELVMQIADCIPETDRYSIDLTTSRSFRYYGKSVIDRKLLVIPDYSGVTGNKAISDLKRLQSKGAIVNDAPRKTASGILHTIKQEVHGHASSIGACQNSKKYFENEPRTVVVGMDVSLDKMQQLMEYDCKKMAGLINHQGQEKAKQLLRYIIKNIHPMEVVNPYASKLMLPLDLPNARTLTVQLLNFVSLVTLFHQHQREVIGGKENASEGQFAKIQTTKEDIKIAIDLFLSAIVVNVDELDFTVRSFFEKLKQMAGNSPKGKKTAFSSLAIREELKLSKTTVNRYLKTLVEYEYIKKIGFKNTGYHYEITNWNNLDALKKVLKERFENQGEPKRMNRQSA